MSTQTRARVGILASWRTRETVKQGALLLILVAVVSLFLFPYYYMLVSSLREPFFVWDRPIPDLAPPIPPRFDAWIRLFTTPVPGLADLETTTAMVLGLKNTLIFCITIVGGSTITSTLAAYAFAKGEFPGRRLIFYIFLYSMIIPGEVTFVPKYVMFHRWHLLGTYWVLIVPGIIGAGGWFLMRMFMSTIPNAYLDAARIDGANEYHIVRHVIFPQSQPVIFTYMVMTFLGTWNDLMGPLLYINQPAKYTLQLILYLIQNSYSVGYGGWSAASDPIGLRFQLLFASIAIASLPMIILFGVFQKRITTGITITGLKL